MRFNRLIGLLLVSASPVAMAATASLDLNKDVVHVDASIQPNPKALEFNAGLYNHDDDSNEESDDDAQIYYLGIVTKDRMTNFRDVEFSLGGQLGQLNADQFDGAYLGLTAIGRYYVPDAKGISIAAGITFAPDILTNDDLDSLYNFNVEASWRIIPRGEILVGYRHIELQIDQADDITFDESLFAGFRLSF